MTRYEDLVEEIRTLNERLDQLGASRSENEDEYMRVQRELDALEEEARNVWVEENES
jgi:hypothetical protein